MLSFSAFTLFGSIILTALHLPDRLLRWAGLVVTAPHRVGLLFPRFDDLLQRPFQWLPAFHTRRAATHSCSASPLGVLYVPCAGPVFAAISIAGAGGAFTGSVAALTISFAVGAAIPLLVFAVAGASLSVRLSSFRRRRRGFRIAGGTVMVLLAVALTFNLTDGLQRAVPNYTQALQDRFENGEAARHALTALADPRSGGDSPSTPSTNPDLAAMTGQAAKGPVVHCISQAKTLANCGPAAAFGGISAWINTPGGAPVSLGEFKGTVVLVNFWTFSCINCQRALPFIRSWYAAYHSSGLEVIGIHTPEFAYEHDLANVRDAVNSEGIAYPVGLDNSSTTWRNYRNSYWPAAYLIDAQGTIRHIANGEGGYANSEALIRDLLRAANPAVTLPAPVDPAVPAG